MSVQRLRRWPNIVQMLYKCFVCTGNWTQLAQQTQGVEPVLVRCCAASQTVVQHWLNVVLSGSVDKCFAPKWNNKFRLIHSLYCPQEPQKPLTLNLLAINLYGYAAGREISPVFWTLLVILQINAHILVSVGCGCSLQTTCPNVGFGGLVLVRAVCTC